MSCIARLGLVEMAEQLRRQERRWRQVGQAAERSGDSSKAAAHFYVAETYHELAATLAHRAFKVELGAGFAKPRAPKSKPARERTIHKVYNFLADGPLTVNELAMLVGLESRTIYNRLYELERQGKVVRGLEPPAGSRSILWRRA